MGRPAKGWWHAREEAYYAEIAGVQRRLDYPDGSPVRRGDDAGRLEALARLIGEARSEPSAARSGQWSAGDVMRAWIAWHRERGSKPRTVTGYVLVLSAWGRHRVAGGKALRHKPADRVGVDDWTSYRRSLVSRKLASRTIEAHLDAIKACWRWASRPVEGRTPSRLVRHDPFRDLLVDLRPERRRVRGVLSPGQLAALIAAAEKVAPEAWRVAWRIQVDSGCRTSEVLSLRWEWWQGRAFVVPPSEHKTGAKTGRPRIVAVTAATAAALESWRRSPLASPVWVVVASHVAGASARPASAAWYGRWWRRVAAGVEGLPSGCSAYWARDSVKAHGDAAGVPSAQLAQAMGHSEVVARGHYSHADLERAIAAVEAVAKSREGGTDV